MLNACILPLSISAPSALCDVWTRLLLHHPAAMCVSVHVGVCACVYGLCEIACCLYNGCNVGMNLDSITLIGGVSLNCT